MAERVFAPYHGLSQLVTSFFASGSLGILHVPFSPFLFLFLARDLVACHRSFRSRQQLVVIFSLLFEMRFGFASIMSICDRYRAQCHVINTDAGKVDGQGVSPASA